MTTDELIGILAERGLSVVISPSGSSSLRGESARVTLALRAALRWHREALIERFRPEPARPREWLFPLGAILGEGDAGHGQEDSGTHPCFATHWRYAGETEWHEVTR